MAKEQGSPKREEGPPPDEAVLSHLEQAEEAFLAQQASWEERERSLKDALANTRDTNRELSRELERSQRQARAERERADRAAAAVRDLHRALFSGDVYELILRACVNITGASRGLYLTWRGPAEAPVVRAAIGVEGYPGSPPSAFLKELTRKVLEKRETMVCNDADDMRGLPAPERPSERFRNCAMAPTVLMHSFDGVVLVADKRDGDFDERDLEALLSVGDEAAVALENLRLSRELQHAYVSTIAVLSDAVEAKDPYTHGHCETASRFARLTAQRLGLPEMEQSIACYAALLHDVGKIGVSDGVLNKPGPLLPEERELVRAHVRVGHDLISHVRALDPVARAVLHHHEWYDGTGYPEGLKGAEIPIASRIVAVVDAYDAMTTRRSYKEAYAEEYARQELMRFAGTQFDPDVVQAFLGMLDSPEAYAEDEGGACGLLPFVRGEAVSR